MQCLQRLHGGREPWVRHGGTLLALSRLRDKELLSPLEYARLASAYQFMRHSNTGCSSMRTARPTRCRESKDQLDLLARKMPVHPACPAPARWSANSIITSRSVQDLYDA